MLVLIRHAQSQMNLAKSRNPGLLHSQTGVIWSQDLIDAGITTLGETQVAQKRQEAQRLDITKVYVSPLLRALQTCDGLFAGHPNSPRIVVFPYATEIVSDAGDLSLGNHAHRSQFPAYDWSLMDEQHPVYWLQSVSDAEVFRSAMARTSEMGEILTTLCGEMERRHPDYLEAKKESKRRVATMRRVVLEDLQRGERVAIVGHADILRQLMKTTAPKGQVGREAASPPVT